MQHRSTVAEAAQRLGIITALTQNILELPTSSEAALPGSPEAATEQP